MSFRDLTESGQWKFVSSLEISWRQLGVKADASTEIQAAHLINKIRKLLHLCRSDLSHFSALSCNDTADSSFTKTYRVFKSILSRNMSSHDSLF